MKLNGIGTKISGGFLAVLLLLIVVAFFGATNMNAASGGFAEYRAMARDSNLVGRLQANMLMVRLYVKEFILSGSAESKDKYGEYKERMLGFLDTAKTEIQNSERAAKLRTY